MLQCREYKLAMEYEIIIDNCRIIRIEKLLVEDSTPLIYVPFMQDVFLVSQVLFEKRFINYKFNSEIYKNMIEVDISEFVNIENPIDEIADLKCERNRVKLLDMILDILPENQEMPCYGEMSEMLIREYISSKVLQDMYDYNTCKQIVASLLFLFYGELSGLRRVLAMRRKEFAELEDELEIDDEIACKEVQQERLNKYRFSGEKALKEFFVENIENIRIHGKKIYLYVDEKGVVGIEYRIETGVIDVLCKDEDGNFVVMEFKLERGNDKVIGQITRYMGYIKKHLAQENKVYGVIIVRKADKKLLYALKVVQGISVYQYDVLFDLCELSEI